MKILKNYLLIVFVALCIISAVISQPPPATAHPPISKDGHQNLVFPNRYQAPTMTVQVPFANMTAPLLSDAMKEADPNMKTRRQDFIQTIRYTHYNLTRGEADQMFLFADVNHDDLLDQNEWSIFTTLFVYPFEACDFNKDYLLDENEFIACFDNDPRTKYLAFRRKYKTYYHRELLNILSTRGRTSINFNDYLFLRKTMFGWKQCHSNAKYIAMTAFQCALRLAVPQKYSLKIEYHKIYEEGIKLANDNSLIQLDFVSYVRILRFVYYFTVFSSPQYDPFIEKVQFLKAVREDRLPNNWDENEIAFIYDLINVNPFHATSEMNFESFCFFFNLHILFNKYSKEKPLLLNRFELAQLMNDQWAPINITIAVDQSKSHFSQKEYLEASIILQKMKPDEEEFFYRFKETMSKANLEAKQDASEQRTATNDIMTTNSSYYDIYRNETNRYVFFTSMAEMRKKFISKLDLYRGYQIANLFTHLIKDVRRIVSVPTLIENLYESYARVNPPINFEQQKNYEVYKFLPKEIYLDLLSFLATENYWFKLKTTQISSYKKIHETYLKTILKDFGMQNMPDTVLDLAKTGFDSLRRRVYDMKKAIRYTIITHCVAAEQVRNTENFDIYGLPANDDDSRKFQQDPRRFNVSRLA